MWFLIDMSWSCSCYLGAMAHLLIVNLERLSWALLRQRLPIICQLEDDESSGDVITFSFRDFLAISLVLQVHYVHFFSIRISLNLFCVLWWQPLFLRLTCLCRRLVWCLIGFSFPRSGRIYPVWWVYFVMKSSIQSHIMVWARTSTEYVAGYGFPSVASWSSVCLSSSWRSSCGWLLARRKHGVLIVGYGEQNLWK